MALIPQGGLRARAVPRIPANLIAGSGISIVKNGQLYTISVSSTSLDGDRGDIEVTGDGLVWTINDGVVTYAKMQEMVAAGFLGATGAGPVEELDSAQATALLDEFSATTQGLVPPSGVADATKYLRDDGQWIVPLPGAGDVIGPAVATDRGIVTFDGTTGKIIRSNTVIIDASGNFTGVGSIAAGGTIIGTNTVTATRSGNNAALVTTRTDAHGAATVGALEFFGTSGTIKYGFLSCVAVDVTGASEDGRIDTVTKIAGADVVVASFGDTISFNRAVNSIELGHLTDTTLARASAGNISIEGNLVYRAGGTDVPIADGGTGASTAAAAFTALKQAASETDTGVVEMATTTEAKAGTDTTRAITAAGLRSNTGLQLLSTKTASNSATISFLPADGVTTAYDGFLITLTDIQPVSDGVFLQAQYTSDGGGSFLATNYDWALGTLTVGTATLTVSQNAAQTAMALSPLTGFDNGEGINGNLWLNNLLNNRSKRIMVDTTGATTAGLLYNTRGATWRTGNLGAMNGIRFLFNSGNISEGTFRLYGIRSVS